MKLVEIQKELPLSGFPQPNLHELKKDWESYLSHLTKLIPDIHIEDKGEVVYLGELSPGCRMCKDGKWDCVFTTVRCNLSCPFCINPKSIPEDYAGSAFGSNPEEILGNYSSTDIQGISFSGGEPFTNPQKLLRWVKSFRHRMPTCYMWIYTNGILVTKNVLSALAGLGINEIRFNTAASGYDNPLVLENISHAVKEIPSVTVEIPVIPAHFPKLIQTVEIWSDIGIQYLNLHELMYEPGTQSETLPGNRQHIALNDGHQFAINPESRLLILEIMQKIKSENLHLSVNDCSIQSKIRQLRGRRRNIARLVKNSYEKLLDDEFYETLCSYEETGESQFWHPDQREEMIKNAPGHHFARMVRVAPLSVREREHWLSFENIIR